MPLILLAILILYFLFILVRSLAFIDHHRVTVEKLLATFLLAALVPLGMGLGKLLTAYGFTGTVNVIGWGLWLFVPYILRLVIYLLVYRLRDRGRQDPLPPREMDEGAPVPEE
ncbi:hypothetical protein [Emcibacter nanhaiensis]|uniref:Uncharacterized protein n=1 Tax=Emcibacter nanhaiensis TaxID=1505037 RepID=A0A501PBB0_9PROT|nr:hypothetical protein [Emcibacter nanhaiensis]TPD57689.1 hypothetical protein FIV46_16420 [Emcibacter nanhaiensis]